MITTVIFDMDGLMIDSERVYFETYRRACNDFGGDIDIAFYKLLLGKPEWVDRKMLKERFGDDFPIEEVVKRHHIYTEEYFETKGIPLKEGIMELLAYLSNSNIKMIVASSSKRRRIEGVLKQTGFIQYIDQYIGGDEVKIGKPCPEVFIKAAQKMNSQVEECLVIEDSEAGIEAAHAANIKVVCIPDMKYPEPIFEEKTYKIVSSLHDVINVVEALNK